MIHSQQNENHNSSTSNHKEHNVSQNNFDQDDVALDMEGLKRMISGCQAKDAPFVMNLLLETLQQVEYRQTVVIGIQEEIRNFVGQLLMKESNLHYLLHQFINHCTSHNKLEIVAKIFNIEQLFIILQHNLNNESDVRNIGNVILQLCHGCINHGTDKVVSICVQLFQQYQQNSDVMMIFTECVQHLNSDVQSVQQWIPLVEHTLYYIQKNNPNDVLIADNIHLLSILCFQHPYLTQLHQHNIFDIMKWILHQHIESVELCISISIFYNSISYHNDPIKEFLIKDNTLNLLITMLIKHINNNKLVLQTSKTIASFSTLKISHNTLLDLEVIRMFQHWSLLDQNDIAIYQSMLFTIVQLTTYTLIDKLIQQNVTMLLLKCISIHIYHQPTIHICLKLITQFNYQRDAIIQFSKHNGFAILLTIIELYAAEFHIVIACLESLNQVLSIDLDISDLLLSYNINQNIVDILRNIKIQSKNNKMQTTFQELLKLISLLSSDSIKCQILWQTDFMDLTAQLMCNPDNHLSRITAESFIHIMNMYSQIQELSIVMLPNLDIVYIIMDSHINSHDIILDSLNLIINLIQSCPNIIDQIVLQFQNMTVRLLQHYVEQEIIQKKILDLYETILKIDDKYRNLLLESIRNLQLPNNNDLRRLQSNSLYGVTQLNDKEYLTRGVPCRLFKDNGSYSDLTVFITLDLSTLQCKHPKEKAIKQKWKLPIQCITSIQDYINDKESWKLSAFKKGNILSQSKHMRYVEPDAVRCFSIFGQVVVGSQSQAIQFNICAPSLLDKLRMIEYLNILIQSI